MSNLPPLNIISTNTSTLEEAQVICLLAEHNRFPSESQKRHQHLYQQLIQELYNNKSLILVEDSHQKEKHELKTNQLFHLDLASYEIQGWDDPEASALGSKLSSELNAILGIIQRLQINKNYFLTEELRNDYRRLIAFLEKHDPSHDSFTHRISTHVNEIESIPETSFKEVNEIFLLQSMLVALKVREKHVLDHFSQRQDHLIKTIHTHLRTGKKRIFVMMGNAHGDPSNGLMKPEAERLIQSISTVAYVIIHGDRPCASSTSQLAPSIKIDNQNIFNRSANFLLTLSLKNPFSFPDGTSLLRSASSNFFEKTSLHFTLGIEFFKSGLERSTCKDSLIGRVITLLNRK